MVKLSTCSHIPSKHCNDSYDKRNGEKMKKVGEIEKNEKGGREGDMSMKRQERHN